MSEENSDMHEAVLQALREILRSVERIYKGWADEGVKSPPNDGELRLIVDEVSKASDAMEFLIAEEV